MHSSADSKVVARYSKFDIRFEGPLVSASTQSQAGLKTYPGWVLVLLSWLCIQRYRSNLAWCGLTLNPLLASHQLRNVVQQPH